jgi:hypothetical protein
VKLFRFVESRAFFCLFCGLWPTIHCSETHSNESYRDLIKTCFLLSTGVSYVEHVVRLSMEFLSVLHVKQRLCLPSENQNYMLSITFVVHTLYQR